MTTNAGVLRTADSLACARDVLADVAGRVSADATDPASVELHNLATVGLALLAAAEHRTESRGAHARTDHPDASEAFRHRLVIGN